MSILTTLSRQVMHGYRISKHIRQVSADALKVEEGALDPADNRRARRYRLTAAVRPQLRGTEISFSRLMAAIARLMKTT